MVGDTGRTQVFQDLLKAKFGKDTLYRRLHSVESMAKGACLSAIQDSQGIIININETPVSSNASRDDKISKMRQLEQEYEL